MHQISGNQVSLLPAPADLDKSSSSGHHLSGDKLKPHNFTFDQAYWSHDPGDPHFTAQDKVFRDLGEDVVTQSYSGYNMCVFAYGQTGSGKTYTMEGGPGIEEDMEQCGVIPRTIRQIFEMKKQLVEKSWSYKLHV